MKNLMKVVFAGSIVALVAACASNMSMSQGGSSKEQLLTQAGFQLKSVTTANQLKRLNALAPNRVSLVHYKGHAYYVYPEVDAKQFYVGGKKQYLAFKQLMMDNRAALRSTAPDRDVSAVEISEGPNPIVIREYDGWGPLLPETY